MSWSRFFYSLLIFDQAKHPSFSGSRESSSALSSTVHGQSFTNSSSAAAANGSTDRSNSVLSSSPSQHQPRAVSTTTASSSSHHGSGSWRASFSKAASGGGGGGGSGVAAVEVSEAHAKRVKVRFGEYSGLCRELTLFCIWEPVKCFLCLLLFICVCLRGKVPIYPFLIPLAMCMCNSAN